MQFTDNAIKFTTRASYFIFTSVSVTRRYNGCLFTFLVRTYLKYYLHIEFLHCEENTISSTIKEKEYSSPGPSQLSFRCCLPNNPPGAFSLRCNSPVMRSWIFRVARNELWTSPWHQRLQRRRSTKHIKWHVQVQIYIPRSINLWKWKVSSKRQVMIRRSPTYFQPYHLNVLNIC